LCDSVSFFICLFLFLVSWCLVFRADFVHSAGFYAENLLLYSQQARNEGLLPLPIGKNHKFAPVALGVSFS